MARTPLFQQMKGALSVAREAVHRNVPSRQVVQDRWAKPRSRQRYRVTDWAKPKEASAAESPLTERIVIIGAGLAGLSCAYQLKKAGYTAEIYEASERSGGRCWTRRGDFDNGQIAEHGGELIDSHHTDLLRLVRELNLPLDDVLQAQQRGSEELYFFDGAPYTYAEACEDFQLIWPALRSEAAAVNLPALYNRYTARGLELDRMSVIDWIEENVPGGIRSKLGKLIDLAYSVEYGAESREQSALNMISLLAASDPGRLDIYGQSDERYHVKGGNDQIASRLAEALQGQIQYRTRLTAIRQTAGGGYTLSLQSSAGSREITCDRVVLTIPFTMLRSSVDYSGAGFRPLKMAAIEELGMGTHSKLHVQFKRRHWETLGCTGAMYSDSGYQSTWEATRAQTGDTGILVNYTGGTIGAGFDRGTPANRAEQFLAQLEPVLPGITAEWNHRATIDYWKGYRWTLGSYSFWRVGQYTKFAGMEREKEGTCHFAGEHTSVEYQGFMNGAVESGQRAAKEILADLQAAGVTDSSLQPTI